MYFVILYVISFLCSFNRIDIPPYETYEKFYEKLTCAVEETCGFAVEWVPGGQTKLIMDTTLRFLTQPTEGRVLAFEFES